MKAQLRQAMDYGGPEVIALIDADIVCYQAASMAEGKARLTVRLAKTSRSTMPGIK